jgi:hypothetical protein
MNDKLTKSIKLTYEFLPNELYGREIKEHIFYTGKEYEEAIHTIHQNPDKYKVIKAEHVQTVWALEVIYRGIVETYANLEDAKKDALKIIHDFYGDSEEFKYDYRAAVTELKGTYNENEGFHVDYWFYCYKIPSISNT